MNHVSSIPFTHEEIIQSLYSDIEDVFTQAGACVPSVMDLYHCTQWRYCQPINPKHKSKIGYICLYSHAGRKPVIRITVHSFAHGGCTFNFNSHGYHDDYSYQITVKKPDIALAMKRKTLEEDYRRRRYNMFIEHKNLWKKGNVSVEKHPYIVKKGITKTSTSRVYGNKLLLPIKNFDDPIVAIQAILPSGKKYIFGKKKGGFIALGSIPSADQLYFCEGYATGSAIFNLVKKTQPRKAPFAVIVALDNKNLEQVMKLFKAHFPQKSLIVCPDNDVHKVSETNGNAGMLSGLRCMLDHRCQCKQLPNHLLSNGQSDWCDLWLSDPEAAQAAFAKTVSMTRFEAARARCEHFKINDTSISVKKACIRALNIGAATYPLLTDEKELLAQIQETMRYTGLSTTHILSLWKKIKHRLFDRSLRARSLSQDQPENTETLWVDSFEEVHFKVQELRKKHAKAIFITNAPMGLGKTKNFMKPEFMAAETLGERPVVITPTRSLTQGVSERFKCAHYMHDDFYSRANGLQYLPTALAITINSIIAPRFQEIFTYTRSVFIDEYTQVLRAITSGTVANTQRNTTEKKLASLINQSHYTYIADADFNNIAINHLSSIVGNERKIFVFSMKKEITKKQQQGVEYQFLRNSDQTFAKNSLIEEIMNAVNLGERLYIVSDSKEQLKILYARLRKAKIHSLLITSDTVHFPKQRKFLDHPDNYLAEIKPQVVLVSPTIQSGISIESHYFDCCFGIYKGIVTPLVFQQMLHRVRNMKRFKLSLPGCTHRTIPASENAFAILSASYMQHYRQMGGEENVQDDSKTEQHDIGNITIYKNKEGGIIIKGDPEYQRFEVLHAETTAMDKEQCHNAANFLLMHAIDRGITISPIIPDSSNSDKKTMKQRHKKEKAKQKDEETHCILNAEPMDNLGAIKKSIRHNVSTQDTHFELKRAEIVQTLHQNPKKLTKDDIVFYEHNGPHAVANYHDLLQGPNVAKEQDLNGYRRGIAKMSALWQENRVHLMKKIFDVLGFNYKTGKGTYTSDQACKVRESIRQDRSLYQYVTFKLGLNVNSQLPDVSFVNKILKKVFGLKMERKLVRKGERRHWIYSIMEQSMNTLLHYYAMKFGRVLWP